MYISTLQQYDKMIGLQKYDDIVVFNLHIAKSPRIFQAEMFQPLLITAGQHHLATPGLQVAISFMILRAPVIAIWKIIMKEAIEDVRGEL